MNFILAIPIEFRLALLFCIGVFLGAAANALIYGQRFAPRSISPWLAPSPKAPPRRWFDRFPIVGWFFLRRESSLHGPGFWLRPAMVELLLGIGAAALYLYETEGGLLPPDFPRPFPPALVLTLHLQFAAHLVLIFWMTAASLIDFDETVIPDSITIPGTLCGLLLAGFLPQSLLPDIAGANSYLHLAAPNPWPPILDPPGLAGLALGIACWLLWCFALLPRNWYSRHGYWHALQVCLNRIRRERSSLWIGILAAIGVYVTLNFYWTEGSYWHGFLSALVGMAVGGAMLWGVRLIGGFVLQREAMGFGDVTLMAMIGSFLGWQSCLLIFFIAPFAALAVGLLRLLFLHKKEIPFGPYLCLAALVTILAWDSLWNHVVLFFAVGWLIPLVVLACFALMPLLLFPIRWLVGCIERQ